MAILQATEISGSVTLGAPLTVPNLSNTAIGNLTGTEKSLVVHSSTDGDLYRHDGSNVVRGFGIQGLSGAKGNQGAVGPGGPQGAVGASGFHGAQGNPGGTGNPGARGTRAGAQGIQGAQGVQGAKGPTGNPGPAGYQGYMGAKGPQGNAGNTGNQGATGNANNQAGAIGVQGAIGPAGYQGYMGAAGGGGNQGPRGLRSGAKGPTGARGAKGPTGVQGATGNQGPRGVSQPSNNLGTAPQGSYVNFTRVGLGVGPQNQAIDARGGNTTAVKSSNNSNSGGGWRQYINSNPYSWHFRGDQNPGVTLHYWKSNGQYYHKGNISSDVRLKKEITPYTASVLDTKLGEKHRASSFIVIKNQVSKSEWTASAEDKADIGFVAQHFTASAPEVVYMADTGSLGIQEGGVTAMLTKAFQEISASLTSLNNRIKTLEG